jgi:predicted DNA-binding protein (MmcQ/YjbR family)
VTADGLRTFCLSLPHATEDVKWGNDLCFLIEEKMFAVTALEPTEGHFASFKCTEERFAELTELDGIHPAAYMARNHWVTLERGDVLRDAEIKSLLRESYGLVVAKLPKRVQAGLTVARKPQRKKQKPTAKSRRSASR